jgi:quercetin dioxygenase-like cupin family protein
VLAMGGAPDDDGIDAHSMRSKIVALERAMFDINDGESNADSCPLTHHFAPGVYGREILLPKGVRVVGKIHRHAHLNVVVSGRAMVATEFGKREVKGGDIFVSEPGAKRAVHALEDTVWMTIHPNESNTQDMSAIEEYVIAPDYGAIGMQAPELLEVT